MNGRRLSVGAEVTTEGGTHFRVFAPEPRALAVHIDRGPHVRLEREPDGHWSGFVPDVRAGATYKYELDDEGAFPDPASRFQPAGPHGPSEVIDPSAFAWTDSEWPGVQLKGQVIYEAHVGTLTKEGTWSAATGELERLRDVGVTLLEIMPIAEFDGAFGWGYDGVDLYAPTHLYGRPDDLRAFVDRAHALGLGVILDVVYNHFGPCGNYLAKYAQSYFTDRYENDWGEAIDFETTPAVRRFFIENAIYWIRDFHFDGLRLDATQSIFDASSPHVITEIIREARAAAPSRSILVVAENEPQDPKLIREYGVDAMWNDDFHHSARVAATGRAEAYYSNTSGTPQELISAMKWGFLFQGQLYPWQEGTRGGPALDISPPAFVTYLQNHDQVANSATGARLHQQTDVRIVRALTTLQLLSPGTPMLFQGQEVGATSPFLYFADHEPELAALVEKGRHEFLTQFPSIERGSVRPPHARATFEASKLDARDRSSALEVFHRDLLSLRRTDEIFRQQRADHMHGSVLGAQAFLLRWPDRLLLVNLGHDLDLTKLAEPLLAPPTREGWSILLSTEDPKYGGAGTPAIGPLGELVLPAASAILLWPARCTSPGP